MLAAMKTVIHIHRYTLRSKGALNAKSSRSEHPGALIRVEDEGCHGYGCVHPWPELGDEELDKHLEMLASGTKTALVARAMECAGLDGHARRVKASLFAGIVVPRSHASLSMDEDDFESAVNAGYSCVKVKVGKEVASEVDFIRDQAQRFADLSWRLDFNGVLDTAEVERFLANLGEDVRGKIDFIEDAYKLGSTPWVNAAGPYGIPMAVDREVADACGDFGVMVIKPALLTARPLLRRALRERKRVVFTSYMDHPLGQCFAAWEAGRALASFPDVVDTCGLNTQGLFEPNAFSEAMRATGPEFSPPKGTGLGFDDELSNLSWELLS